MQQPVFLARFSCEEKQLFGTLGSVEKGRDMKIYISEEVAARCPGVWMGVLRYQAEVKEAGEAFSALFEAEIGRLEQEYRLEQVAKRPQIAATRVAYKALGKAPQEYRNSAEAMSRRVAKKNGLYRISSIVDIGNLFSVETGLSLGSYDVDRISGDVELKRAPEGTHYDGIGKSSVNIGCLPVLYDDKGPFGNPTSDSQRAMLQPGDRDIMTVVYGFGGEQDSEAEALLSGLEKLLKEYGEAGNIRRYVVRPGKLDGGKGEPCLL